MGVLRAVVSDKDGVNHELVLKKRSNNAGYSWFYGNVPLVVTPARTQDEAMQILRRELSPQLESPLQILSFIRSQED